MGLVWSIEWDVVIFLIISAILIVGSLAIIWSKEIVRSVMWLTMVFVGVGAVYILLGSEYLGIIQILIYVGAVSVLMLFGIMLTSAACWEVTVMNKRKVVIGVAAVLVPGRACRLCPNDPSGPDGTMTDTDNAELGLTMFNEYGIAVLMVGFVLFVSMLGGVFIAKEDKE